MGQALSGKLKQHIFWCLHTAKVFNWTIEVYYRVTVRGECYCYLSPGNIQHRRMSENRNKPTQTALCAIRQIGRYRIISLTVTSKKLSRWQQNMGIYKWNLFSQTFWSPLWYHWVERAPLVKHNKPSTIVNIELRVNTAHIFDFFT